LAEDLGRCVQAGSEIGISKIVVTPPAAAACVSLSKVPSFRMAGRPAVEVDVDGTGQDVEARGIQLTACRPEPARLLDFDDSPRLRFRCRRRPRRRR
jgi:hypothetical protein